LLPSDGYRPRVFVANGFTCYRLNAGGAQGTWSELPARIGASSGIRRDHGHAILLPTGQVALVGGVQDSRSENAIAALQPEIYDPQVDWPSGTYLEDALPDAVGNWIELDDDPAELARGYHSTALLLPDGRIWTGGSTEDGGSPYVVEERRMEIWQPPYPAGTRPVIKVRISCVAYGGSIPISVTLASGASVRNVALLRCGSCTHGFDSDQRYVALSFTGSMNLSAQVPTDPDVVPPGFYMLWVVDSAGRPCAEAACAASATKSSTCSWSAVRSRVTRSRRTGRRRTSRKHST
jgi:hypothetical protein